MINIIGADGRLYEVSKEGLKVLDDQVIKTLTDITLKVSEQFPTTVDTIQGLNDLAAAVPMFHP